MKKKVLGLLLAVMTAAMLTACGGGKEADTSAASESTDAAVSEETSSDESTDAAEDSSAEKKTLKVAMECGYAPYNWTQADDSNGAVKINDSSDYAYGYDVMMAKKIADALGYELQIVKLDWDSSDTINDSVHLHIKMRAPKNAQGFSFDFRFFSREYPYYVCSRFNDFFLTLLTDESGKPIAGVNPDGNISFDKAGNPVSVNNAFFTTCANLYFLWYNNLVFQF